MKNEKLAALVIEAQKGNQKALSDLIESCYNDIYYFALKTVKNEDTAADITQDSCIKIIEHLSSLKDPAAFKSWALQVTYNQCKMHFRATKDVLVDENEDGETIFDTLADDSEDAQPDKAYENAEFKQMMRDIIESLPPEQASAVMLYYYEKMSVSEIADIHGVSSGTVKSIEPGCVYCCHSEGVSPWESPGTAFEFAPGSRRLPEGECPEGAERPPWGAPLRARNDSFGR